MSLIEPVESTAVFGPLSRPVKFGDWLAVGIDEGSGLRPYLALVKSVDANGPSDVEWFGKGDDFDIMEVTGMDGFVPFDDAGLGAGNTATRANLRNFHWIFLSDL